MIKFVQLLQHQRNIKQIIVNSNYKNNRKIIFLWELFRIIKNKTKHNTKLKNPS